MADCRSCGQIFMLFALSLTVNALVIDTSTVNAICVHYFSTCFFSRSLEIISFLNACIFYYGAVHATWQSISILLVLSCCFARTSVLAAELSCIMPPIQRKHRWCCLARCRRQRHRYHTLWDRGCECVHVPVSLSPGCARLSTRTINKIKCTRHLHWRMKEALLLFLCFAQSRCNFLQYSNISHMYHTSMDIAVTTRAQRMLRLLCMERLRITNVPNLC